MTSTPPAPPERPPYISPPPSKQDVENVSNDQGMIADEWAPQLGAEPEDDAPGKAKPDDPA